MMLAYKTKLLDNLVVHSEAETALGLGLITSEENTAIKEKYVAPLYRPNIFMRIGYFIATLIGVNVTVGFISLFVLSAGSDFVWAIFSFICALAIYLALEWLIRHRNHFRSGVDDGLLWCSSGYMLAALIIFTNTSSTIYLSFIILIISLLSVLRFANPLMSFIAYCALLSLLVNLLILTGPISKLLVPFAIMIMSGIIYLIMRRIQQLESTRHYLWSLIVAETLAIIFFYLAGNYYIIREIGSELLNIRLVPGQGIAGGWFFWATTIIVPLGYVAFGLRKKDALLLRVGIPATMVSVVTVWYYTRFCSIEGLMVAGGTVFMLTSYFVSKLFSEPRWGIIDKLEKEQEIPGTAQVEGLVVSETLASNTGSQPGGFKFGGGSSGGAGASGNW